MKFKTVKRKRFNILKKLFKRNTGYSGAKSRRSFNNRRTINKFGRILLLVLLSAIFIFFIYNLFNYVSNIRARAMDEKQDTSKMVVGIDLIPEYPYSSFIFSDKMNDDTVTRFLTSGQSVYRLEPTKTIADAFEYYNRVLPQKGWNLVLDVPQESEEQRYGQYWSNDENAVRIYSKLQDICYQKVTLKEATEGLSEDVKRQTELQLLLIENDNQELRPDYPWKLNFSNDYVALYRGTDFGEYIAIDFKKLGGSNTVSLEPLGYFGAMNYESFLDKGIKIINEREKADWQVQSTVVSIISGEEALLGSIVNKGASSTAYIFNNPRNGIVYMLWSTDNNDPFMKFMIEKLSPAKSIN